MSLDSSPEPSPERVPENNGHGGLPESPRVRPSERDAELVAAAESGEVVEYIEEEQGGGAYRSTITRGREALGGLVLGVALLLGLLAGMYGGGAVLTHGNASSLVPAGSGALVLAQSVGVMLGLSAVLLVAGALGAVLGGFLGESLTLRLGLRDRL